MRKMTNSGFGLTLTGFVALWFCVGCGGDKLDVSNDQAYSTSIAKIYQALPEDEREEFRKNFSAVLSEIPKFGSAKLNENDLMKLYDYVKLFGGEEGAEMLEALHGLTAKDIKKQGRAIRKTQIGERLGRMKAELAAMEKAIEKDKQFALEFQKVAVVCTGVELKEGADHAGKPWGAVHTISALITVTNNSSEPVQHIRGVVTFSDDVDGKINELSLTNLQEVGTGKSFGPSFLKPGWEIPAGETGHGEVVLQFYGPNKKHPFPAGKKYSAELSEVKVAFKDEQDHNELNMSLRASSYGRLKDSIDTAEKELASFK